MSAPSTSLVHEARVLAVVGAITKRSLVRVRRMLEKRAGDQAKARAEATQ